MNGGQYEDAHGQYRAALDFVSALKQGVMSAEAKAAWYQLAGLDPDEALGVVCCLVDSVSSSMEAEHLPAAGRWLEDLAAFASVAARRCVDRAGR